MPTRRREIARSELVVGTALSQQELAGPRPDQGGSSLLCAGERFRSLEVGVRRKIGRMGPVAAGQSWLKHHWVEADRVRGVTPGIPALVCGEGGRAPNAPDAEITRARPRSFLSGHPGKPWLLACMARFQRACAFPHCQPSRRALPVWSYAALTVIMVAPPRLRMDCACRQRQ